MCCNYFVLQSADIERRMLHLGFTTSTFVRMQCHHHFAGTIFILRRLRKYFTITFEHTKQLC